MSNLITVDWGTSNFRAKLFDTNNHIIDSISTNNGILNIKNNDFYTFLKNTLSTWLINYQNSIILMSGMIGSKNGWIETPYINTKASIDDIFDTLTEINGVKENIYILPGVQNQNNNQIDLMRGEEIQIFGALKLLKKNNSFLILPGSHSKWVSIQNNSIINFKTNMTGEVFKAISENTILKKSISSTEINPKSFKDGVIFSKEEGGLLSQIFQVRVQATIIKEENVYSFLSGIIIGHEIKEMSKLFQCKEVISVASDTLNILYKIALNEYKINIISLLSDLANNEAMKYIYKKIKEGHISKRK